MEIKNEKMCSNEVRKVALLINEASRLGWDISGYGFADVNPNSGNVYLWLEDQQACLMILSFAWATWLAFSAPSPKIFIK